MKFIDMKYFPPLSPGRFSFFPIRVSWGCHTTEGKRIKGAYGSHAFICCHGWQIGWKNGGRIYGWTLHIGMLKIKFGKDFR